MLSVAKACVVHERAMQEHREAFTVQTLLETNRPPFFLRPFLHTSFVVLDVLVNPRYAKAPPSFSLSVVLATLCVIAPTILLPPFLVVMYVLLSQIQV